MFDVCKQSREAFIKETQHQAINRGAFKRDVTHEWRNRQQILYVPEPCITYMLMPGRDTLYWPKIRRSRYSWMIATSTHIGFVKSLKYATLIFSFDSFESNGVLNVEDSLNLARDISHFSFHQYTKTIVITYGKNGGDLALERDRARVQVAALQQ